MGQDVLSLAPAITQLPLECHTSQDKIVLDTSIAQHITGELGISGGSTIFPGLLFTREGETTKCGYMGRDLGCGKGLGKVMETDEFSGRRAIALWAMWKATHEFSVEVKNALPPAPFSPELVNVVPGSPRLNRVSGERERGGR